VLRPVGMLVGEAIIRANTTTASPIYQAVVLSQAFKNMEADYPHQVANIELFSQERYSQLVKDGHFDDSSLFDVS